MRIGRKCNELRPIFFGPHFIKHAKGSCFVKFGDTHVICAASVDEKVPPFLRNTGTGWITAEYGMLPCSSSERIEREVTKGKPSGRTMEIQRLISRSLRAALDLKKLGERQIRIDCDVIQADGGTRTASISGGFIALYHAIQSLLKERKLKENPILHQIAAVSCGIVEGKPLLDLDYHEDSNADVDSNFVVDENMNFVEIQMTAERQCLSKQQMNQLLDLAQTGLQDILFKQRQAIS